MFLLMFFTDEVELAPHLQGQALRLGQAECALISLLRPLEAPQLLTQEFPRMKTALGVELWGVCIHLSATIIVLPGTKLEIVSQREAGSQKLIYAF